MSAPRPWLVALPILVGLAIRIGIVLVYPDMDLHGDEAHFFLGSMQAAAGDDVSFFPFRPPLYIAFCALVVELFGPSADAIRICQILFEGLSILGLFLLVRRVFDDRAAHLAAWLYALYPDFIVYSHYLWSETIALTLVVWGSIALLRLIERASLGRAAIVGVIWGAASLIKPYMFYMLPLLLAWVVWLGGRAAWGATLRASAAAFVVALATLAPWSIYQSIEEGYPIFICTTGAHNLEVGVNYRPPPQYDLASAWTVTRKQRAASRQREVGVVAFIAQNPGLFFQRTIQKMSYLWSPNSYLIRDIYKEYKLGKKPKYGMPETIPKAWRLGVSYATLLTTMALTILGLAGIFTTGRRDFAGLAAIYTLSYMGMISLTPALSRYRLPLMIFAIAYAAVVLTGRANLRDLQQRPVLASGLLVALMSLFALWSMRLPDLLDAIW